MNAEESPVKDGYLLGRSHSATSRLNYQYYLWQHSLGFHIHPSIPALPADARIVDVATGSGIWLLDLAEKLPATAQLDGLDINLGQCPPEAWLPSNVRFRKWDFFSEVPQDLVAKYDVVHVRVIAITIKNNDSTNVVRNLARLLKPGGYLQWDELDTLTAHVFSTKSGLEVSGLNSLRNLLVSPLKGQKGETILGPRDWIQEIPATLARNGFVNVEKFQYLEGAHMAVFWNDVWALSAEEFADVMLKARDVEREKELRNMVLKATQESEAGAAVRYAKMTVVARRLAN